MMVANRSSWIFAALLTLAACGGGSSLDGSGGGGGGDGDGDGEPATLSLQLAAFTCPTSVPANSVDGCQATTQITPESPARIRATLGVTSGTFDVANRRIQVSAEKTRLDRGESLTDEQGIAYFNLSVGSELEISDVVIATYTETVGEQNYQQEARLTVSVVRVAADEVTVTLSTPGWDSSQPLPDGSTIEVQALVEIDGAVPEVPVTVNFSSICSDQEKAEIDGQVQVRRSVGVTPEIAYAPASYRVKGCSGQDTIYANVQLGGQNATAFLTLPILSSPAARIEFIEAERDYICLDGTGCPGNSTLTFRVVDALGQPKQGSQVSFELLFNQNVDGLVGLSRITSNSALTNNSGEVRVNVVSGNLPVSPRVRATTQAGESGATYPISTVSSVLAVGTGLPHQMGYSLALSAFNVEGGNNDGVEVGITATLADHFGNPVPDGTSVTVVSPESGVVTSNCVTEGGRCSVQWLSGAERPLDRRVTVLAYATGEDSFHDVNGNGLYDLNDYNADEDKEPDERTFSILRDMGEPYVDANENGTYNSNMILEQLIDANLNGIWNGPNGVYDGMLCDINLDRDLCNRTQVQIARSSVIALSDTGSVNVRFCSDWSCTSFLGSGASLPQGTVYACAYSAAPDGLTWNPIAAGSPVTFIVEDPLKIVGRSSFQQLSTSSPIRVLPGAISPAVALTDSQCAAGKFAVNVVGIGPLTVEVNTEKGSYAAASVSIF